MKLNECEYLVEFRNDDEIFHEAISYNSQEGFFFMLLGGFLGDDCEITKRRAKEIIDWMLSSLDGDEKTYISIPFTLKDITYSVIENYFIGKNEDSTLLLNEEDKPKIEECRKALLEQISFLDKMIIYK